MISRGSSQRSSNSGSRPFSSTNPFRAAVIDASLEQYKDDRQFMDWTKANGVQSPPYINNGRNGSSTSFVDSITDNNNSAGGRIYNSGDRTPSPTENRPTHTGTNPFLDDVRNETSNRDNSHSQRQTSPPVYTDNKNSSRKYPTSSEEKERLRQSYMESSDSQSRNNNNNSGRDGERERRGNAPPPAYEDVAAGKSRSSYPKEKHTHRSSSSGEKEGGEHRHHHSSRHSSKSKRKSQLIMPKNVDSIDKLDVTGLFGGSFHHDGPFDAVTPHRNKNVKAAPVLAFPADGPNSTIGGATSRTSTLNEVFGRDQYADENDLYRTRVVDDSSRKKGYRNTIYMGAVGSSTSSTNTMDAIKQYSNNVTQFDAKAKTELVSGPTTAGLGSTTFLDGAPASANAIREDIRNHAHKTRLNNGIQRKKSLSQRLTLGMASGNDHNEGPNLRRGKSDGGNYRNMAHNSFNDDDDEDDDVYIGGNDNSIRFDSNAKKESTGNKLLRRVKSLKVNRK
ncbi:hypothetical protein Kpol_1059p36 [Vanderwaltozyma polyspora DSM 70294]|uniref:Protein PAL1 n=1 Tax=Vanderwaltozyma polyspora (strain ATCC 22028 / DSM 70294 / BCRC 21397 / CBS 2163 / NBRC 10782 / NRRL Y-8283 / UCD 57-17) TaxID=436907 RepID=A7TN40_VANPO|nr:uncharacterized protein Kpol_1059p36 [Vanderwaltozyma polyspora DSM 70294]EDO16346.1 hypothetical protein Kpol_1059p36 [Vanderwaltozyma polyspora DSM 70294]